MFSGETAGQEAISLLSDSPLVQDEPGQEPGDLKHEDAGQTYGGVDTEGLETRHILNKQFSKIQLSDGEMTHSEVSHPESEDVSDAGHSDGHPSMSHCLRDDLTDRPGLVSTGPLHVVETLNYHEHVVDTDT